MCENKGRWSDNKRAVASRRRGLFGVRKGGSGKSSWYQQEMGVEAKMFNG